MENIYFKMKHSGILGIIAGVCAMIIGLLVMISGIVVGIASYATVMF